MTCTAIVSYEKSSYINFFVPRGYDPKTLLIEPLREGIRNIFEIECQNLTGRVKHIIVGVTLLIPVINTIIFLALRAICCKYGIDGAYPITPSSSRISQTDRESISQLNQRRTLLIQQLNATHDEDVKSVYRFELEQIHEEAAPLLKNETRHGVKQHLELIRRHSQIFAHYDGRLARRVQLQYRHNSMKQNPGLSQKVNTVVNDNKLCGYYALYFMMNAVMTHRDRNSFCDRASFNHIFPSWVEIVENLRVAKNLRLWPVIPEGMNLDLESLDGQEFKDLIEKSDALACLRDNPQCFILDLEQYRLANERHLVGHSIETNFTLFSGQQPDPNQPLNFIVRKAGHYYFVYTRNLARGHFYVLDSLNGGYAPFNREDLRDIVECLQQFTATSQSPLQSES